MTANRRWAVGATLLALVGLAVNLWRPLAPPLTGSVTGLETFDPELLATVAEYRGARLWSALLLLALTVLVPALALAWPPARRRLHASIDWAEQRRLGAPLGGAVAATVLVLLTRLVTLAPAFWVGHVREVAWGFRTAGAGDWLRDWSIGVGVEVVIGAVTGALFVALWRRWPTDWHWRLVVIGTVMSAVLVLLQPVVVQPLLLRTEPLPAGDLRDELERVVTASGIDADLRVGDASRRTTRVNAFVTGLGPTRQVVLWDTLLDRPVDEVAVVVAHELAHRDHGDLPRGVLLSAAGLLPFGLVLRRVLGSPEVGERFGVRRVGDPRAVLVLVLVASLAQVVALPPALWFSRRAEAAADHRALLLTRDPAPLVRTFRGFVVRDLSQPAPPLATVLFFGSHPSVDARIRAVVEMAARLGLPLPDLDDIARDERPQRYGRPS